MTPVTVVVATRNRRPQLMRFLPRHTAPVILVDNASDDGTPDAVEAHFPDIRVIRLGRNIGAAARNVGVEAATTPYVAFADDDSYWDGDALARIPRLFDRHPRAGLLAARVLVGEPGRLDPVSRDMATAPLGVAPDLPGPSVLGFLACAAAVRREAFLAVGGFAPELHVYGEEALLAVDLAAAGWGLAYVPELVVRHLPEQHGRDQRARRRRQARNDLLTAWLRRPLGVGLRAARQAATSPDGRAGLVAALCELDWVLRRRRVVPPELEAALRRLGAPGAAGRAPTGPGQGSAGRPPAARTGPAPRSPDRAAASHRSTTGRA